MLDFIFSSTGPELQITLKIVRKFHVFPKNYVIIFLLIFLFSLLLKNKQKNPEHWPLYQDLAGNHETCRDQPVLYNVYKTRSR